MPACSKSSRTIFVKWCACFRSVAHSRYGATKCGVVNEARFQNSVRVLNGEWKNTIRDASKRRSYLIDLLELSNRVNSGSTNDSSHVEGRAHPTGKALTAVTQFVSTDWHVLSFNAQ